jgi:hypothetical protein
MAIQFIFKKMRLRFLIPACFMLLPVWVAGQYYIDFMDSAWLRHHKVRSLTAYTQVHTGSPIAQPQTPVGTLYYNRKGQREKDLNFSEGKQFAETRYFYDRQGRIERQQTRYSNNAQPQEHNFLYQYRDSANVAIETRLNDGVPEYVKERLLDSAGQPVRLIQKDAPFFREQYVSTYKWHNNRLVQQIDRPGPAEMKYDYFYNEAGILTGKEAGCKGAGSKWHSTETFNSSGQQIKFVLDTPAFMTQVIEKEWEGDRLLRMYSTSRQSDYATDVRYTYDKKGLPVQATITSYSTLQDSSYEQYEYNTAGEVLKKTFMYLGRIFHHTSYEYDGNGHLQQEAMTAAGDSLPQQIKKYEYSSKGLLLRQTDMNKTLPYVGEDLMYGKRAPQHYYDTAITQYEYRKGKLAAVYKITVTDSPLWLLLYGRSAPQIEIVFGAERKRPPGYGEPYYGCYITVAGTLSQSVANGYKTVTLKVAVRNTMLADTAAPVQFFTRTVVYKDSVLKELKDEYDNGQVLHRLTVNGNTYTVTSLQSTYQYENNRRTQFSYGNHFTGEQAGVNEYDEEENLVSSRTLTEAKNFEYEEGRLVRDFSSPLQTGITHGIYQRRPVANNTLPNKGFYQYNKEGLLQQYISYGATGEIIKQERYEYENGRLLRKKTGIPKKETVERYRFTCY